MILFGLTIGILTLVMAGFGVTMLVLRRPAQLHFLECICLSWLFGAGTVSLILWIAGAVVSGFPLRVTVGISCVALAIWGWRSAKFNGAEITFQRPAGTLEWLLAGIVVVELGITLLLVVRNPLAWDGSFNWESKARYAFLSGGAIPGAFYSSDSQGPGHPEYPLLVPFTELWLYLWMGEANQFWVKFIFPIFTAAGVILLGVLGTRLSGRRWAGGVTAALLFFVPVLITQPVGIVSGYADFPLGVFYLVAIGYLLVFANSSDPNFFRIAMISVTFLPWMKREGAILWLAAALCALLIEWRRKERWACFGALVPGIAIMVAWNLYLHAMHVVQSHDFIRASLGSLWTNIDRIFPILRFAFREVAYLDFWSFFWLLIATAFTQQLIRRRDLGFLVFAIAMVVPIALYCCSYIFSAWPDYQVHIRYSLFRLLLHVVPVGWLLIATALPARA